jgi:tetratricopeptide (TPR) repeat protein
LTDFTMALNDFRSPDPFVVNAEVSALEQRLEALTGPDRVPGLVELAWHLRQRDTSRALALLDETEALTCSTHPDTAGARNIAARTRLIRGEAHVLFGDFTLALAETEFALNQFEIARDCKGCCDAYVLLASIHENSGNRQRSFDALHAGQEWARQAGDNLRSARIEVQLAYKDVYIKPDEAETRWAARLREFIAAGDSLRFTYSHDFFAELSFNRGDYGASAREFALAFDGASAFGQIDRAVVNALNVSAAFCNLNAFQVGFEWAQRALDLARSTGWPVAISKCLGLMAQCFSELGDVQAAHATASSAIEILGVNRCDRHRAIVSTYMADYTLRLGDPQKALVLYAALPGMPDCPTSVGQLFDQQAGPARAHAALGDSANAVAAAYRALEVLGSEEHKSPMRVLGLMLLADLHIQFDDLALPDGRTSASAALHHLTQAIEVARQIEGYLVPPALLKTTAEQYARLGEHQLAYETELAAAQAHEQSQSRDAKHRAIAMQVRHETDRALANSEHHRQLAAAERRRAETFAQTIEVLNQLGAIGQEVTAQLDAAAVFAALDRHVHRMLDASSFSVMLMDEDERSLTLAFGVESGRTLAPLRLDLADLTLDSVRCVHERRELSLRYDDGATPRNHVPGTLDSRSALFCPLIVDDKVLGVVTIQSPDPQAYGEREQLVFRSLCAYGAIALSNARAYLQLGDALNELREAQTKLMRKREAQARLNADRDATLAFLAHDLRAPLAAIVTLLDESPGHSIVGKVDGFANHALLLTDRFLEAARLGEIALHPDEMPDLV